MFTTNLLLFLTLIVNIILLISSIIDYKYKQKLTNRAIDKLIEETCLCNDWEFGGCTNRAPIYTINHWRYNFTSIIENEIYHIPSEIFLITQCIGIFYIFYRLIDNLILNPRKEKLIEIQLNNKYE
jgi:hypothetical protein